MRTRSVPAASCDPASGPSDVYSTSWITQQDLERDTYTSARSEELRGGTSHESGQSLTDEAAAAF